MNLIGKALRLQSSPLQTAFMICHEWQSSQVNINQTILEHLDGFTPLRLIELAKDPAEWDALVTCTADKINLEHSKYVKEKSVNRQETTKTNTHTNTNTNPKTNTHTEPQASHVTTQTTLDHWSN